MRLILADTGAVSRALTNVPKFSEAFDYIGESNVLINAATKMELFQWINGYKSQLGEKDYRTLLLKINSLNTVQIDRKVSATAVELSRRYFSGVGDLLIAATAIENNIELFTYNKKHFKTIKGVRLYNPPSFQK